MDHELEDQKNELLEKLEESLTVTQSVANSREFNLEKEDLEKFILNTTGDLIVEGLDLVKNLKEIYMTVVDAEQISSLAETYKAVSTALNILKDINIADKKVANNTELKKMDINSKKELIKLKEENKSEISESNKLTCTRDELFKMLMDKEVIIEGDFKETTQSSSNQDLN